eukprot:SAG11_NODE_21513_length_423_cov_40.317901_1_plen_86_part_00
MVLHTQCREARAFLKVQNKLLSKVTSYEYRIKFKIQRIIDKVDLPGLTTSYILSYIYSFGRGLGTHNVLVQYRQLYRYYGTGTCT